MSTPTDNPIATYVVADLVLDLRTRRAELQGRSLELNTLSFELLRELVAAAPETVTYDQLAERVWGRSFVSQEAIAQRIKLLRQALSEDGANPRYIEAVRGKGYRIKAPVEARTLQPGEPPPPSRRKWRLASAIAITLLAAGVGVAVILKPDPDTGVMPNSVAVLPFQNTGPQPASGDCATTAHAEIVHQLTESGLNVIARNSVLRYASDRPPLKELADDLHVGMILDGTIRCDGERVNLILDLTDPATGRSLWGDTYEGSLDEFDAIQREVASRVTAKADARLASVSANTSTQQPSSFAATAALMRAIEAYQQSRVPDALQHLDRAIAVDEHFARAYAYRGVVRAQQLINTNFGVASGAREQDEIVRLVREDATRALQLEPNLGLAHVALGIVDAFFWRWTEARNTFERARRATPNDPEVLFYYSLFQTAMDGDRTLAVETARRAVALDPYSVPARAVLWISLWTMGERAAALSVMREAARLSGTNPAIMGPLSLSEFNAGNHAEAERLQRLIDELIDNNPVGPSMANRHAYGWALFGFPDEAARDIGIFEKWRLTTGANIGLGDQATTYLAARDYANAQGTLERAAAKVRAGQPDAGFFRLRNIRLNIFADPALERPEFVAVRAKLTGR